MEGPVSVDEELNKKRDEENKEGGETFEDENIFYKKYDNSETFLSFEEVSILYREKVNKEGPVSFEEVRKFWKALPFEELEDLWKKVQIKYKDKWRIYRGKSKENIKGAVSQIMRTWGRFITIERKQMDLLPDHLEYDYDGIMSLLRSLPDELPEPERANKNKSKPLSLIESLYLKVLQHECLGSVRDKLYAYNLQIENDYNVPSEYIKEMIKFKDKKISRDTFDKFFEDDNVQRIAKYVYLKPITSEEEGNKLRERGKEERRKIKRNKKKVLAYINFSDDDVSELLIISCLQAILIDREEIPKYAFHGNPKIKLPVKGALNREKYPYDVLCVIWNRKVMNRLYANIGRYDLWCKLRELEKLYFGVLEKIFCSHSLQKPGYRTFDEMWDMHHLYYRRIEEAKLTPNR